MAIKLPVSQKAVNFWRPFGHVTWKPTCVYMTGNGLQSLHMNPRRIFSQTSHPRNHFEGIPGWNFPWWRHHPARSPTQMLLTPDNSDANGKGQRSCFYGTVCLRRVYISWHLKYTMIRMILLIVIGLFVSCCGSHPLVRQDVYTTIWT
jgi:hypothetical protein